MYSITLTCIGLSPFFLNLPDGEIQLKYEPSFNCVSFKNLTFDGIRPKYSQPLLIVASTIA